MYLPLAASSGECGVDRVINNENISWTTELHSTWQTQGLMEFNLSSYSEEKYCYTCTTFKSVRSVTWYSLHVQGATD